MQQNVKLYANYKCIYLCELSEFMFKLLSWLFDLFNNAF